MGKQTIEIQVPDGKYLDSFVRTEAAGPLLKLFRQAHAPAKEITESWAALCHLQERTADVMNQADVCRVIHVGDGAHARTGALFSFMTKTHNISIDPQVNIEKLDRWKHEFDVQRFEYKKERIQDMIPWLNKLPRMKTFVTFVHAHVTTDEILDDLTWDLAYTMACCHPKTQLSSDCVVLEQGDDWSCLAQQRTYQILCPVGRKKIGE